MQVVIDGLLTNYLIFGKSEGETVLILHGWGQSTKQWADVAKLLSLEHKVYLVDLPGFGSSNKPEYTWTSFEYADFVKKFVQKTKIGPLSLIAHSFGGKIAIILASEKMIDINKLFLISPSGINDRSLNTKIKIAVAKILKVFVPKSVRKYLSSVFASDDYLNAGSMIDIFKKTVAENVSDLATKIKIPTFIFWGEFDNQVPFKTLFKLKRLIKGSVVRVIWKGGHSPQIENPKKLSNLISEYL